MWLPEPDLELFYRLNGTRFMFDTGFVGGGGGPPWKNFFVLKGFNPPPPPPRSAKAHIKDKDGRGNPPNNADLGTSSTENYFKSHTGNALS